MAKRTKGKGVGIEALAGQAAKAKAQSIARKKKRGEALIALIQRRKERIVEDFYDIGEALREILRDELYVALGHASFGELLDARQLVSRSQAHKLIAVVDAVPREEALRAGLEQSYALISYAAATPENDSPAALIASDARIDGKPVSKASVRDIVKAARTARPKKKKAPADRARAKLERTMMTLVRGVLGGAGVPRPTLSVEGDSVVARWSFRALGKLRER